MAMGLASAGAAVVIGARQQSKSEVALHQLRGVQADCDAIPLDVGSADSCRQAIATIVQRFGRLDILLNNAGMSVRKLPQDLTEPDWQTVIDINLTGALRCAQAAYPHLKTGGRGKIINIGSMYSQFGAPMVAAYAASKGGIVQLTRSLAAAWAPDQIQVNAILPGWIDTELTQTARLQISSLNDAVLSRTPAGRWGNPEDLAGAAIFLSGEASKFVTGSCITVDGGYSSRG